MLFVFSSTYIKKFEPVPVSILVKSNIETNSFVHNVVTFREADGKYFLYVGEEEPFAQGDYCL